MLSLPVHFPYCCQSSLAKRTIWSCSRTFDRSFPLVKAQILCIGVQDLSQLKQPIFLSSHTTSSHFWAPWDNSLFPIHTMNSHIGLFTGSVFTNTHPSQTLGLLGHPLDSLSVPHLCYDTSYCSSFPPFFPVSPTDHKCMRAISDWLL